MGTFLGNTISKLYNVVATPVTATRDALAERLESIRKTASVLYKRMMENMEYGRQRLKDIVEKEAEEEAKEQQQEEAGARGKTCKKFRVTGNLNKSNTKMIMANITPHIEMRTKVIYSFKSEIHLGAGEIVPHYKTLTSPPGMFTSFEQIQAYIEESEQKRLALDNEEIWSKAYLPAERTTEARGNYEGKVIFKHVKAV